MDPMKLQIQQKMIAGVLVDKCRHHKSILFEPSWCTQERILRFTTPYWRNLFPHRKNRPGTWETGDFAMYEVHNLPEQLQIQCVIDRKDLPKDYEPDQKQLTELMAGFSQEEENITVLRQWVIDWHQDLGELFQSFDGFLNVELPAFERLLSEGPAQLEEGSLYERISHTYERNPEARRLCLAAKGTACSICGMDFASVYGPAFADRIEVHHIVPLSSLGKGHVVDPVRDLIPVCPNCHTALHSKKCGVYTPEELKELMRRQNCKE